MARSREMLLSEAEQKFKELRFTDDFVFCKILEQNPDFTKNILEIILGFKIKEIKVQQQKPMEITGKAKGIRVDIYAEDEDKDIYDLEMQTVIKRELPKRARYYQSVIDLDMIQRGSEYSDLRKSYVIFICLTDPFDQGQYIYTIKNSCMECTEMNYEDETYKIFINASGTKGEISDDMKAFIALLRGDHVNHPLIDKINRAVEKLRRDAHWRNEYMTEYLDRQDHIEEGKMEMARVVIANMNRLGMTPEEMAEITNFSTDFILKILAEKIEN